MEKYFPLTKKAKIVYGMKENNFHVKCFPYLISLTNYACWCIRTESVAPRV